MSQNHFTLSFPLKSPADAKVLAEELPPLMPQMFQAADTIGTIHYSRFTVLSEKTLLFLGDFDGEFGQLMADLAKARRAGVRCHLSSMWTIRRPLRSPIMQTLSSNGLRAIWSSPLNLYTAYPDVTAKEIKALAAAADVTGGVEQRPFLVILPIKSHLAFVEVQLLLRARSRGTQKDLDTVGTPHFAQFVPLGKTRSVSLPSMTAPSINTLPISPKYRTGLRSGIQIHQEPAALAMQKASPGVHRLCGGGEPCSDRVLPGLSGPDGSGHPCPDRR